MKDYEITFVLQVKASDNVSQDDVLNAIKKHSELDKASVIDAEREISISDVAASIFCLSIGNSDGFEKYDVLVNFLQRETEHSKQFNEKMKIISASLGMTDEDYKEKQKPKRQPKVTLKDIATVWQKCTVKDSILKLPSEQLDRKVYDEVKKQLESVGGKWTGGKTQGFVFAETTDVNDLLTQLQSGKDYNQEKKDYQFFATPAEVADELVKQVGEISDNAKVLEPSAGRGALIKAVHRINDKIEIDAFEAMPENKKVLQKM